MASTLDEFFGRLHREVALPSCGLTVALRRPDNTMFITLGEELPTPTAAPGEDGSVPMTATQALRFTELLIAESVIMPPFSDVRDDQGKPIYSAHYVHVSELDAEDKGFLVQRLCAMAGLTMEAARGVEAFCDNPQREDGAGIGDGIRGTAAPSLAV